MVVVQQEMVQRQFRARLSGDDSEGAGDRSRQS